MLPEDVFVEYKGIIEVVGTEKSPFIATDMPFSNLWCATKQPK